MIGPYCQLTVGQGLCYVAGSLGLVPSTMRLTDGGAGSQAALALRNCSAVLAGLGGCSFLANEFQPLDATPPPPARVAGVAPGS